MYQNVPTFNIIWIWNQCVRKYTTYIEGYGARFLFVAPWKFTRYGIQEWRLDHKPQSFRLLWIQHQLYPTIHSRIWFRKVLLKQQAWSFFVGGWWLHRFYQEMMLYTQKLPSNNERLWCSDGFFDLPPLLGQTKISSIVHLLDTSSHSCHCGLRNSFSCSMGMKRGTCRTDEDDEDWWKHRMNKNPVYSLGWNIWYKHISMLGRTPKFDQLSLRHWLAFGHHGQNLHTNAKVY